MIAKTNQNFYLTFTRSNKDFTNKEFNPYPSERNATGTATLLVVGKQTIEDTRR